MGLFQATTPTSAGAAQVFDTGGIVALVEQQKQREIEQSKYRYQQRQKAEDRLLKATKEFSPEGMFPPHIPNFTKSVEEYNNFLKDNHVALTNPSQNMDVWNKKMAMENSIRTDIAASIGKNKDFNQKNMLYHQNNRYRTPENQAALNRDLETPTDEAYADLSAYAPTQINPHYDINMDKYVKTLEKVRETKEQLDQMGGKHGGDYLQYGGDYFYPEKASAVALAPEWGMQMDEAGNPVVEDENPTYEQKEVRENFKTFDNFLKAVIQSSEKEEKGRLVRKRTITQKAATTVEKNRPFRIQGGMNTQGRTAVQKVTGTEGRRKNKTVVLSSGTLEGGDDSETPVTYASDAVWSLPSIKGIKPRGDVAGLNISSGKYGQLEGKHIVGYDASHIAWMDYSIKPMYAVYEGIGPDGQPQRSIKHIKAGEPLSVNTGYTLYTDDGSSPESYMNGQKEAMKLDNEQINAGSHKGRDLFVFTQVYESAEAFKTYDPVSEAKFDVTGPSRGQWLQRYSDIAPEIDHKFKQLYPNEYAEIMGAGESTVDPFDAAKAAFERNQIK